MKIGKEINLKNSKGITLVALVVTIIVLLILSGVTISLVFNETGVIEQAKRAGEVQANATEYENEKLNELLEKMESMLNTETDVTAGWNLDNVTAVTSEDGIKVPVPVGYTASSIVGETTVAGGFVIYEGEDPVTDFDTVKSSRNQYVWVPADVDDMYGERTDGTNTKYGKLSETYSTEYGTGRREPDVVTGTTGADYLTAGTNYDATNFSSVLENFDSYTSEDPATVEDFRDQLQSEFDFMIESVRTYGGFYIGRYETGNLNQTTAVVQYGNADIRNSADILWYGMYNKCKTLAVNSNVTTSMIWGSQWDATLTYFGDAPAVATGSIQNSGESGNKHKNIYDMSGNLYDWTFEANDTIYRVGRGGYYGYSDSASYRVISRPTDTSNVLGCRSTLLMNP